MHLRYTLVRGRCGRWSLGLVLGAHTAFPHISGDPKRRRWNSYFASRLSNMNTIPTVAVFCASTGVVPFRNAGLLD